MPDDIKIVLSDKAKIRSEVNKVAKGTIDPEMPVSEFTISFNKNIDAAMLDKATVFIIDATGEYLRSEIRKIVPERSFVLRPLEKYRENYPYYLVIAPKSNNKEPHSRSIFVKFTLKGGALGESKVLTGKDPQIAYILRTKDITQFADRNVRIITESDLRSLKSGPCNKIVDGTQLGGALYLTEESLLFKGRITRADEKPQFNETYNLLDIKEIILALLFNEFILIMKNGDKHVFRVNKRNNWVETINGLREEAAKRPRPSVTEPTSE